MIQRALEKKRSGEGGFTLVELLIVIIILGILAAIVVLAIGGLSDTAEGATCKSGAKALESAEDAFYASSDPDAPTYGSLAQLWNGGDPATKLIKSDPTAKYTITGAGTPPSLVDGYIIAGAGQCAGKFTAITGP